jgi:hypothetical protein
VLEFRLFISVILHTGERYHALHVAVAAGTQHVALFQAVHVSDDGDTEYTHTPFEKVTVIVFLNTA